VTGAGLLEAVRDLFGGGFRGDVVPVLDSDRSGDPADAEHDSDEKE
jgi:hypothetical protein